MRKGDSACQDRKTNKKAPSAKAKQLPKSPPVHLRSLTKELVDRLAQDCCLIGKASWSVEINHESNQHVQAADP